MKALIFESDRKEMFFDEVTLSDLLPDEILIETKYAGICHSDRHFWEGRFPTKVPTILGHEASGIIRELGSNVSNFSIGDSVIISLSQHCGQCGNCLSGNYVLCVDIENTIVGHLSNGTELPTFLGVSAFAEFIKVHRSGVVPISSKLPLSYASVLGCAMLTGFGAVQHVSQLQLRDAVMVLGCGGVGLSLINALKIHGGYHIIAVDMKPEALKLALKMGASKAVLVEENTLQTFQKSYPELTNFDYVFECVGKKQLVEIGLAVLKPGGHLIVLGLLSKEDSIEMSPIHFVQEKKITGCFLGSGSLQSDIRLYAYLYEMGLLKLEYLVRSIISFEELGNFFNRPLENQIGRTIVKIS